MTIMQNAVGICDGPTIISNVALPNQTSDAARSLSMTTHQIGDMIFAMTANRTTTAPSLLTDYTNINSVNSAENRSFRIQYKFASNTTETINWTGAYGAMISIRNASAILQSNVITSGTSSITINLPDISGLNTSGKSLVLGGTYFLDLVATTSPYTLLSNVAVYLEKNSSASHISKTVTISSGTIASVSYITEIL